MSNAQSDLNVGSDIVRASAHSHGCGCSACQSDKQDDRPSEDEVNPGRSDIEGAVGDSPQTSGFLSVGGTVTGFIDYVWDRDWYGVTLQAGRTYEFEMRGLDSGGGSLSDPYLALYSQFSNFLTENDDGGQGFDSLLTFTASTSGTYYISAESFSAGTGSFRLSVTQIDALPLPNDDWADSPFFSSSALRALSWDTRIDHSNITVYFAQAGEIADGVTSEGFNAFERAQFELAFDLIEAVIDVQFTVVNNPNNVDMQLVLDTNEIDSLGFFNPPGETSAGIGVFNGAEWNRSAGGDLTVGGFGFQTIVHELLHGLGMSHPHDFGGDSIRLPGVTSDFDDYGDFDLNQGVYTTMSYNRGLQTGVSGTEGGSVGSVFGIQSGPMAFDIAVLQALYGANTNYNNGNTDYVLDSVNAVNTYWTSIWDTGGIDTIRHTGTGGATIDLREATLEVEQGGGGFLSQVNGIAGGFTIANGVVIERAFGGESNDIIIGNDAANALFGLGGLDTISGGWGNDFIHGYGGNDDLRGENGHDRIIGGDGLDRLFGGNGSDTLSGGKGADTLYGAGGNDRLFGDLNSGLSKDELHGGDGVDTLYGGHGFDLLYGDADNDYLDGGAQADNLFGGTGNDTLVGGQGLDRLFGGLGNDVGFGGDGNDGMFGDDGDDRLFGQNGNDRFFGGSGNDELFGNFGEDTINGGSGFDTMDGGIGNDVLEGRFNADVFVFGNGHGNDTVSDFAADNIFERLDFSGLSSLNSLAQVLAAGGQVGANYLIQTGNVNSILLVGVNESQLDNTDFIF